MNRPVHRNQSVGKAFAIVALFAGCDFGATTCANGTLFSDQAPSAGAPPNQDDTPVSTTRTTEAPASVTSGPSSDDVTPDPEQRVDTDPGFHVIYRNPPAAPTETAVVPPPPTPVASAPAPQPTPSPPPPPPSDQGDLVLVAPPAPYAVETRPEPPKPPLNGGPAYEPPPIPAGTGIPIVQNPGYEPPPPAQRPGIPIQQNPPRSGR